LSISDAIRLLMLRIADERRLPFEVTSPNAASVRAMRELEAGKGKRVANVDALFKELGIRSNISGFKPPGRIIT
jgi:DNA-damage-inducible protein J